MAGLLLSAAIVGVTLASMFAALLFIAVGIADERDPRAFNFAAAGFGLLLLALMLAGYVGSVLGGAV